MLGRGTWFIWGCLGPVTGWHPKGFFLQEWKEEAAQLGIILLPLVLIWAECVSVGQGLFWK